MKKNLKKLTLQKETVADLQQVAGGKIIGYYNTIPIDDTVYYPPPASNACSRGCVTYA